LTELIGQVRPAGIIVAAPLSNMSSIVRTIGATGTPCVRLSTGSGSAREYTIGTNDREISAEMTRYLASLGHRRIAFVKGNRQHRAVGNRYEGYKDGLEQSGLPYSEELVADGDNSIGSGERCAEDMLRRSPRPTAIFSANDDMAAGVLRAANRLGIRVPEELSIAGCDDIALAQQIYPALTTIRQPLSAMSELASLALVNSARGNPHQPGLDVVPGTIQIRGSTAPAPE